MGKSNARRVASQVGCYAGQLTQGGGVALHELLCGELVEEVLRESGVWFRECVFTPMVTLWTFLTQALCADRSCRNAVARLLAFRAARREKLPSPCSGPYCKARSRLPERFLATLTRRFGGHLHQHGLPFGQLLAGRPVKFVDGSTVSMPDTPANQQAYPQPPSQKPGIGFPLARIVAVFSMASGAVLDLAIGPYRGKQTGETSLFRTLWDRVFSPGDVAVGDRYYCSYWDLALLPGRGVDVVFRGHQRRHCDFRRGRRLGKHDHLVTYLKPKRPEWMDEATYQQLPDQVVVREVRIQVGTPGFRVETLDLVTTLLDAQLAGKDQIAQVYRARWHAELDLRAIKCTLGMDVLRCKTPEMVRKEIWVGLLAYNLIRMTMLEAAQRHGIPPREISFTGALQTLRAFRDVFQLADSQHFERLYTQMLNALATHRVGDRPDRVEPRAVKRRPKPHRLLNEPRAVARARLISRS